MNSLFTLFMGQAPAWYKRALLAALVLNTFCFLTMGSFITGWIMLVEFLAILALALESYPLFPGGLVAFQALALHLAPGFHVMQEIRANIDVLLLLMFLVPAISYMKPLLLWIFIRLFSTIRDKTILSIVFLSAGAFLSAWLDALTVVAVIMTVCGAVRDLQASLAEEDPVQHEEFYGFLKNLLMHGAVGTAVGGVATLIGEPQNILIGHATGWGFTEFFVRMAHFSLPVAAAALLTCWCLEHFRLRALGFGYQLPEKTAILLKEYARRQASRQSNIDRTNLGIMGVMLGLLILALAFQVAPLGIIGLAMLIGLPALTGQTSEQQLGESFKESLPFAALIVVFFVIAVMIGHLGLFAPITSWALHAPAKGQTTAFFFASGILSSVSDNVFVATVYINEASKALAQGLIDKTRFETLAITINAGTNIFAIVTPNGQAAFLFLLTSGLARQLNLSYVAMLRLAFPYAVTLVITALLAI